MPKSPKVALSELQPLLVTRAQTRILLACSDSKLRELERQGKLTPRKLTGGFASTVTYTFAQVEALAHGEGGDHA
jgi:hypothetical protein